VLWLPHCQAAWEQFCSSPHLYLPEKQNINAEDCRKSSQSTWVVLDPPRITDPKPLSTACNPGSLTSNTTKRPLQFIQVSLSHLLSWRKLHSPAQLVGIDCTPLDKAVGLINRVKFPTVPGGEGWLYKVLGLTRPVGGRGYSNYRK
jgi:hypothetical protein